MNDRGNGKLQYLSIQIIIRLLKLKRLLLSRWLKRCCFGFGN